MSFLDSSAVRVRDDDFEIGFAFGGAATFAEERHGFYALGFGGGERVENVWRISAGRKTNEQVVGVGQPFDLSGENVIEAVVIANAREQCTIGHEANGGKGGAVISEMTDQFLGKVHGIRGAAPVTAGEDLAARFEGGNGGGGDLLEGSLLRGERLQRAAGIFNQLWQNGFHKEHLSVG